MGSLLLAVASGFLGGIALLASGVGLARVRRRGVLRACGLLLLVMIVVLAFLSGIAFVWLAMSLHAPAVSAFTLGASLGAAVGVAVAFSVGLALVAWVVLSSPARAATSGYGHSGHAPLGRRLGQW